MRVFADKSAKVAGRRVRNRLPYSFIPHRFAPEYIRPIVPLQSLVTFILASESPRRSELLTQAGFVFRTRPADLDEERLTPAHIRPCTLRYIWPDLKPTR